MEHIFGCQLKTLSDNMGHISNLSLVCSCYSYAIRDLGTQQVVRSLYDTSTSRLQLENLYVGIYAAMNT
jgi:hypothetical protein